MSLYLNLMARHREGRGSSRSGESLLYYITKLLASKKKLVIRLDELIKDCAWVI